MNKNERIILAFVCALLFVSRFWYISGPLDGHVARQVWSAYPAQIMATEWPPEVFHAKMPMNGSDWISPGSFPIYELIVSCVYRVIGEPNLTAARAVNLLLFGVSAVYLFLSVSMLWRERAAWYSILFYFTLPLGVFYSRAVHYETQLLFFGLGYLYHGMAYGSTRKPTHAMAAAILAILGFLIKAPVMAIFVLAILVWYWVNGRRAIQDYLFPLLVPMVGVALGFCYYRHVIQTWDSVYVQIVSDLVSSGNHQHLFGAFMDRLSPGEWIMMARKFERFLIPRELIFPVFFGGWALWASSDRRQRLISSALAAGLALFVIVCFAMLKKPDHEWYLVPMSVPVAIALGFAAEYLVTSARSCRYVAAVSLVILVAVSSLTLAQRTKLFEVDYQINAAGAMAGRLTPEHDLVIFTGIGRSVWRTDSRLPYLSGRLGWSRKPHELASADMEKLVAKGAEWLAVVITTDFPPPESLQDFAYLGREPTLHPLSQVDERTNGWLALYDLSNWNP